MRPSIILVINLFYVWTIQDKAGATDAPVKFVAKSSDLIIAHGKEEIELIETYAKRSNLPSVGNCWREALFSLKVSCQDLNEESQSRLALAFTSCFSQMMGENGIICEPSNPVKNCLSLLEGGSKDTFRAYFLQTQNICFYIQSELWHTETERMVNSLQTVTAETHEKVREQKLIADDILATQHKAQEVQDTMLKENVQLFDKVVVMKTMMEESGRQTKEHQAIFLDIFEKLRRMHELVEWIQGEMSLVDLVGFYICGAIFAYFLTTSRQLEGSRIWVYISLAIAFITERKLYSILSGYPYWAPNDIVDAIWNYRRGIIVICIVLVIWHAARFRDIHRLNNDILLEIKHQMAGFILELQQKSLVTPTNTTPNSFINVATSPMPLNHHGSRLGHQSSAIDIATQYSDSSSHSLPSNKQKISAHANSSLSSGNNTTLLVSSPEPNNMPSTSAQAYGNIFRSQTSSLVPRGETTTESDSDAESQSEKRDDEKEPESQVVNDESESSMDENDTLADLRPNAPLTSPTTSSNFLTNLTNQMSSLIRIPARTESQERDFDDDTLEQTLDQNRHEVENNTEGPRYNFRVRGTTPSYRDDPPVSVYTRRKSRKTQSRRTIKTNYYSSDDD